MVDEGKNSVFEGALVWSKSEDYDAIWKAAKVLHVGHLNEGNHKIEIQVELEEDGTRAIIKTRYEDSHPEEYQNIKLRTTITSTGGGGAPILHNADLPSLPLVNEPEILERIRYCHMKNIRYLSVGPVLLFLHRYETIPSRFNPKSYQGYHLVDDLRHDIVNPLSPPHLTHLIYQIHLKITTTTTTTSPTQPLSSAAASSPSPSSPFRSTQAIIMLGESGSGKSKNSKDICSHLSYLASTTVRKQNHTPPSLSSSSSSVTSSRPSAPVTYLPDIQLFESIHCILDSFGHAQTTRNPYSSRYSKAIKISYDEDTGLMKGILYRCFHLESNRVVEQANGESNYRVFYDVFDDIYFAAQAMSKYGIDNLTLFRYTSKRPTSAFQPGKSSYKDLSAALESLTNIPKVKQNTSIFGLLAAILHLGELEFDVMDNYGDINTVLSADPVSVDRQNRVLSLLGLSIDSLSSAITKKNLNFAGNIVEKNLDLTESMIARDALACQLYSALFRWIVSKINEGIAAKFPFQKNKSPSPPSSGFGAEQDLSPPPQNTFFLYDLTGFENIERNSLDQLCINYANERIFQFLNQIIYLLDKELFYSENISLPSAFSSSSPSTDNSLTIRLLDNRSNGIFTICDDQLKLRSSTSDEKLANILYTQHGSNKSFLFSKTEQKNCEFIVKHYAVQVKYSVVGFTSTNKLEPTTEILDCLKSSSLPFVKEELFAFCDSKTLAMVSSHTGLSPAVDLSSFKQTSSRNLMERSPSSRKLMERSPSSRNFFDKSPSSRNLGGRGSFDSNDPRRGENFKKQRSFAHSHADISQSSIAPGRGLMRAPSLAVRSPSGGGGPPSSPSSRNITSKVATLTSSCSAMMTEILAEAKLSDVTFFLCLKLNDCSDPLKYDQQTIIRQLKPYGIPDILSFYHHTYPYRLDHVSFLNRFCLLSLICSKDKNISHDFMIALWECRSHGLDNIREWQQLCHELVPLIPSLPEFDTLSGPLLLASSTSSSASPSSSQPLSDEEQMIAIRKGIKIGEANVYLTALSFTYLTAVQTFAIELLKQRIWNFYKNSKSKFRQKAGCVIGSLMLKFLDRNRVEKRVKRNASIIAIQARVRCFLVHRRLQKAKQAQEQEQVQDDVIVDLVIDHPNGDDDQTTPAMEDDHDGSSMSEEVMISVDFDDHIQLTGDVILEKVEVDSVDLSRNNEGNINLEDVSSKGEHESIDPTAATLGRLYARHANSVSGDTNEEEKNEELSLEPIQVDQSVELPSTPQNLLSHFNADGNNPPSLSLAQQSKITELQSKVDSLESENSRLRRKLESLSSFVREEEKTPEPSVSHSKKKLASRMSSVASYMDESIYGGEMSRSMQHHLITPSSSEIRPDYEKYVQKTLETLEEDITYLLHGAPFYKFGRSGSVHKTLIYLSSDFRYVYWKPKNSLLKTNEECRVDLRLVWRLVPGHSTPPFQAYKGISHGPMPPKRSFSLIYGFRSLDLCAFDDETYDNWFIGLKYVLQLINGELQEAGLDRQLLRKKWNYIDRNNHGFLSRREIIQLVSALGIQFDRSSFTTALLKSTIGNSSHDEITFSQFDSLVYQLRRRPDLEILWSKVIAGYDFSTDILPLHLHGGMGGQAPFDSSLLQQVIGLSTFKTFWKLSQQRVLSDDEARKMISEGMGEMHQEDFPILSFNGFVSIMTHYKNDVYDPVSCIHSARSMCHPLQHYYISSSDGAAVDLPNQEFYRSHSLDEERPNPYVTALHNGCRALELRCFEEAINPQGGEQTDLYVGNPRSKDRVTFKETLLHIHRVAFTSSHFPLILLMEISCNIPQQKRAAKLLHKLFGNAIFKPSEVHNKLLPSPLDLKNRVLIFLIHRKRDIHTAYRVNKDLERMDTAMTTTVGEGFGANNSFLSMKSSQSFDTERRKNRVGAGGATGGGGGGGGRGNIIQQINESFDFVEEHVEEDYDSESEYGLDPPINSVTANNKSHSRVPRSDYLALDPEAGAAMDKNGTLDKSQMDLIQKCDVIHSSLMSLCHYSRGLRIGSHPLRDMLARLADDPQAEEALVSFNLKRFTYIYMDHTTKKFGSYGGMVNAWDCGISLVSLCHEFPTLGTKINSGRFRENGNCGFILKPERYREDAQPASAAVDDPLMLTIHIISGKDLPFPKTLDSTADSSPYPPFRAEQKTPTSLSRGYSVDYPIENKTADTRIVQTQTYDLNSIQETPNHTASPTRSKGFSVMIDLNGATCDDAQNKTRSIKRHGRSPYWNEVFTFSVKETSQGQLTLRIFYNEMCTCYASIPLQNLRSGYRSVALYEENEQNNFTSTRLPLGSLFVRVRFDGIAQYHDLQALPENQQTMEPMKKTSLLRNVSSFASASPVTNRKGERKTPRRAASASSDRRDLRRSRSEDRSHSREAKGTPHSASRGITSYESTPIITEAEEAGAGGPQGQRKSAIDFDQSAPSRARARRETKPRRKSEAGFEISEEMMSHYKTAEQDFEGNFSYQEVIETENKENANKKLSAKRLSQTEGGGGGAGERETMINPWQTAAQPASNPLMRGTSSSHLTQQPSQPPQPPPPPPRREPEQETKEQHKEDDHLPSYNSAVNLIELREQNARSIRKFEIDSGDEMTENRSSSDPWAAPV